MAKGKNQGQPKRQLAKWTQLGALPQRVGASIVRRLTISAAAVTLSAGGQFALRQQDSTVANAQEWANISAIYSQYRVLAMRIHVVPAFSSAAYAMHGVVGTDRSGAAAVPGTLGAVWGLQSPKIFLESMTKPFSYEARGIDLEDQLFTPVGAPTPRFALQMVINGPATTQVAYYYVDFMVEFKGTTA